MYQQNCYDGSILEHLAYLIIGFNDVANAYFLAGMS